LAYAGLYKLLVIGLPGFIGYMQTTFAKTWVPEALVSYSSYAIVAAEVLLCICLVVGVLPRIAWVLTAILMFGLLVGQTVLQDYNNVANIWQYLILCIVCASLNPCPCLKDSSEISNKECCSTKS